MIKFIFPEVFTSVKTTNKSIKQACVLYSLHFPINKNDIIHSDIGEMSRI